MFDILDALLAPFARLMVARGISFPDLSERLKAHYLEAARRQAEGEGKVTDSRLSLMTGLQRRDIARLKSLEMPPARPNHLARLVALWQTEPGYHDENGPLKLPRNGPAPSFEALAQTVRRDVHPRSMADTLEAAGTIEQTADGGRLKLVQRSYQPLAGSEDQLAYLAANMGDHLAAATDNVTLSPPPHFERAVHYGGLTEDQVKHLKSQHDTGQMALFQTLSQNAAELKKDNPPTASARFRAGAYFYQTERPD